MNRSEHKHLCPIVCIGGAAGSLAALQPLLRSLPLKLGFAYVVVVHLDADGHSTLSRTLSGWTSLPVLPARAGDAPQRDKVYVQLADDILTLGDGCFLTRPRSAPGPEPGTDTIDIFLESLAANSGAQALAVILSGPGSDGAAGSAQIKRADGIVLAQEPSTARHADMPRSVISIGAADYVLRPAAIAAQLARIAAIRLDTESAALNLSSMRALDAILGAMQGQMRTNFDAYRPTPLIHRLRMRMEERGAASLQDYQALLDKEPGELDTLVHGVPFHVTQFFRDPLAWDELQQFADTLLISRKSGLRAWVTACSTGEEAYSLAMMLTERAEAHGLEPSFRVFATDMSPQLVARAGKGVFSQHSVENVTPERLARFFYRSGKDYRAKRSLREHLVFAEQDLLLDPPLRGFDIVTCRNLLIYLTPQAGNAVMDSLAMALNDDGVLFLGKDEGSFNAHGLDALRYRSAIYRKSLAATACGPAEEDEAARPPEHWSQELQASDDAIAALCEKTLALDHSRNDALRLANTALQQVNGILRKTVHELEMQREILGSGAVITLFLDQALRVRWFTPAVTEVFPLVPRDMGRPLTHLRPRFHDPALFDDVQNVMETNSPREMEVHHKDGRWFIRSVRPHLGTSTGDAGVAITFADITRRKIAEAELQESQACLADQNVAFRAAMNGAPLAAALTPLVRTAVAHLGKNVRCAFYLTDPAGRELFYVTGMGEAYSRCVDGFKVGPDSLACGLAVHTGKPVITPDVLDEAGWREWTWLAKDFAFRGCWSFPIETASGKVVGTLAVYHSKPRAADEKDLRLAAMVTSAAAIIISRYGMHENGSGAQRSVSLSAGFSP